MEKFNLSDRYRLELHWDKVLYEKEGVCKVVGANFSGPALNEATRINDNDFLKLDFFEQYLVLVDHVYVAEFSWGEVEYINDKVYLKSTFITHDTELNKVPKFKDSDYLIIDTSNHTTELHAYNLVYKTYVVNQNTNLYRFGK